MNRRPLITFALFAYNQERFIQEALNGAFSQTYSPLEIILSDDCSHDSTFKIMEDMAMKYNGPHKVILNRNDANLGIARHVNRVFELSHGQLVIFAAGDDISLPERALVNYQAWETSNRKSLCIFSGVSKIDKEGKELIIDRFNHPCIKSGEFIEGTYSVFDVCSGIKPLIVGGAAAWCPLLMEIFGPLPEICVNEDEMLALRTACVGSFTFIKSNLIKYRVHENNICARYPNRAIFLDELEREDAKDQFSLDNRSKMYEAFVLDLETAKKQSLIHESIFELAVAECRKNQKIMKMKLGCYQSSFVKKVRLLFQLKKMGLPLSSLRSLFYRLLPVSVYRALRLWKNRFFMDLQNKKFCL